jgi:hypothetical protein
MATSVSHSPPAAVPPSEPARSGAELGPKSADSESRGSNRFDPAVAIDLPLALPDTDAEIGLVATYLGDLINQILSEPE